MVNEYQIRVVPQVAAGEESIRQYVAREYGFDARTVTGIRVLKRSIDARQRTVYVNLKVRVYINEQPHDDMFVRTEYGDVSGARRVVVVGEGPGGLFAALRLIELGLCPVVVERGKDVHERKKDLSRITKTQQVDTESNYCFGEGGREPIPTANCIPAARNAEIRRRFSMCSASTVLRRPYWPMPILTSVPTDCRG